MAIRLTPPQAAKLGIPAAPEPPASARSHEGMVATYSDQMLEALIADLGRRNLRDLRDHETRWSAQRLSAARKERRKRHALAK